MFATLAGRLVADDDPTPLAGILAVQADAGLSLLSDGRVHPIGAGLPAAWGALAGAAAASGIPGGACKLAVRGPWGAGERDGSAGAPHLAALAAAGCTYIEVHEPAAALAADVPGLAAFAAVHVALLAALPAGVHASLAITGGNADGIPAPVLFAAPYGSHLFDLVNGPENWKHVVAAPGDRGIIAGVVDARGLRRLGREEITWAVGYAASTGGRGRVRVGIAPSGDLDGLAPARARELLSLLGETAALLAGDAETIVSALDPRAIDARTAALGHAARRVRQGR